MKMVEIFRFKIKLLLIEDKRNFEECARLLKQFNIKFISTNYTI